MKILHLSDFHYKSSQKDIAAQNIVISKMLSSLPDEKFDFLLFTGDLVFSGERQEDFVSAYEALIVPIGKKLSLNRTNVIFCPGNHDVARSKINQPLKEYIRRIEKGSELTEIVEKNDPHIFGASCEPTRNYVEFSERFFKEGVKNGEDEIYPLFSLHYRHIDNKKIGFLSMNTAWCSTGDDDRGNLFFPKSELEKAIDLLNQKGVQIKILLLHHPLTDFRESNRMELEDLIYSEFHFLFSGHLHKREDFIKLTLNEGIFGSYAHAAFTKKDDGQIGYSILEIDMDTMDIILTKYTYDYGELIFTKQTPINLTFPFKEEKADQVKIIKTIRKRLHETIDNANELVVTTKELKVERGFLDLFVDPVLKSKPDVDVSNSVVTSPRIPIKSLLGKNNYLVYGRDKVGKTTILYKLQIDLLKSYLQLGEIPLLIDLNEYKNKPKSLDILKLASKFLEANFEKTKKILKKQSVKLLFDNYDPAKKEITKTIVDFIREFPNANYVLVADQTLVRSFEKLDYGINSYEIIFIHDISRAEIRKLTNKWPNIPNDKKEDFIDKIIEILRQHSMPFNFWTLSIFLWIFSGKNTMNFNNNAELIELYVDDLLDRNSLANNPTNRFSYQNYKLFLSELALELLQKHRDDNYSIKFSDLINFTEEFMKDNPKRVGNTSDIIGYLLERGVLKKIDDDYITFRLNGVFEYFIAYSFIDHNEFLKEVIKEDSYYLSFKNELEIYSGFQRSETENREFLTDIHIKTMSAFSELNERMVGDLDFRLNNALEGKEYLDISKPISLLATDPELLPLSHEEKDEILDLSVGAVKNEIEVKPKRIYDVSVKNFEILERYLEINEEYLEILTI